MRKLLSLILAVTMLLTIVPAFAETADPATDGEEDGLTDLLGGLLGGEDEEGSGLTDLLGGLLGGEGEEGAGLGDLLGGLLGGEGEEGAGLGDLLGGLLGGEGEEGAGLSGLLSGLLGGEGGSGLSGLLDSLMGQLGGASGKLSTLLSTVKDFLGSHLDNMKGVDFSGLLNGVLGKFSGTRSAEGAEGAEGFDAADLLGGLLSGLLGGSSEEMSDEEWAQMLEEYHNSPEYQDELARNAVIEAYVLNEYQDTLEAGDVQLVCFGAGIDDYMEDGSFKYLRVFSLTNFTADGANLMEKNYASNAELLVLAKNAEGTYEITEALQAEEGENYEASIEAMAELYGAELDTVKINLGRKESSEAFALADFLREHPEYEKAEFQGELHTAEELDDIALDLLGEELKDVDFSF